MRSVGLAGAVALVALVVATAAGASGSSNRSSQASTPGVTAKTITFGMVAPLTGPVSALGLDSRAAITALMDKVNAAGGINGRKLQLIAQDDKYDPQQAVAGAKYFASQKPVFAIWGNVGTATTLASLPTYQAAGLPVLFPEALTNKLLDDPTAFAITPGFADEYRVLSKFMARDPQYAHHNVCFLYQNDGTSIESVQGFKQGPTYVTDAVTFERTDTSYAAQVQRLKSDACTFVLYIGNPSQLAVALRQADDIGYHPQWIGSLGITSPDTSKLAGKLAEGVMTVNPHVSPQSNVPGAVAFRAAMSKYQPGATQSGYALFQWIGGQIIIDALKRAGRNLTRASFVNALQHTSHLRMGGLTPTVAITPTNHVANKCISLLVDKDGVFQPLGKFICG